MDIIDDILRREGGYVWHGADRGGPTNFGITLTTLAGYRGAPVTEQDVRQMTESEARAIYLSRYVARPKFDLIADDLLRRAVIDAGVNHGTSRAAGWLQVAVGVTPDGKIGPVTLAAVNGMNPFALRLKFMAMRARFYGALIGKDRSQAAFAQGWLNRFADVLEEA